MSRSPRCPPTGRRLEEAYLELTRDAVEFRAEAGGGDRCVTARHAPPERPSAGPRDRFARLLRAEWTKFRTVRGWVIGIFIAAAGHRLAACSRCRVQPHAQCSNGTGAGSYDVGLPRPAHRAGRRGGEGQLLLRAPAAGRNGSITVRVTSLTGLYQAPAGQRRVGAPAASGADPAG